MEISFGAKYINSSGFKKIGNKEPIKIDAAVVQLDHTNIGDWYAIESFADKLSKNNRKSNYAIEIRDSFNKLVDGDIAGDNLYHYVLTTQLSDFEHLNPEEIRSTFLIADKLRLSKKRLRSLNAKTEYVTKIRFLQGSPDSYYGNPNRKYSGIGGASLDFILDTFTRYDIVLKADTSEIPFYKSRNFKQITNPYASDMMIHHV